MPVICVSYDLHQGSRDDYEQLYKALGKFTGRRVLQSTWVLSTKKWGAKEVYAFLKPHVDAKDKVFISRIQVGGSWWTQGLTTVLASWLQGLLTLVKH